MARPSSKSPETRSDDRERRTAHAIECIRGLVNALGESARTVEERTGLTNAQLYLLRLLDSETDLTVNDLTARSLTQQSTVSVIVTRLAKAGYVERIRSAVDARRVHIRLTRRGRALVRRAPEPPLGQMIDALDDLPAADAKALIRGIGSLLRHMRAPRSRRPLFEARRA